MSLKEVGWKTGLFILLPGLLTYGCLREQEDLVRVEAAQRTCLKALYSPTVTTLLLVGQMPDGHLVHKRCPAASA
jgi:hypothetical protein